MASYAWNVRAGLAAAYGLAADWTGVGGPPGPGDVATIGGGGIAATTLDLLLGMSVGQSGTLLLSGGGTSLTAGGLGVGVFGKGRLAITSGATLITTGAGGVDAVGYEGGSVGAATIDGIGSVWDSRAAFLNVGYQGQATLRVSNGGALATAGYLAVDAVAGGMATVTADGAGSAIRASAGIAIDGGGGRLSASNGATLATAGVVDRVGDVSGAGHVTLASGARWIEAAQSLIVADASGASSLAIGAGAALLVGQALQVGDAGMAGAVSITAGGSLVVTAASQNLGYAVTLGAASGASGAITLAGAGAVLDTGGNPLQLGSLGSGTLAVGAGALVRIGVSDDTVIDAAAALSLGDTAGGLGVLSVNGAGAMVSIAGGGFAGSGGTGHIAVSAGGVLAAGDAATIAGGFGLSIGAGAPPPGTTRIMSGGSADLAIGTGGTVLERNGFSVGLHASTGSATIASGGLLEFAGQMAISNGDRTTGAGNGSVTVAAGGTLLSLGATIADPLAAAQQPGLAIGQGSYGNAGVAGTLVVTGAAAVVNLGGAGISVGGMAGSDQAGGGTGFLTVSAGGSVISGSAAALAIGVAANAAGVVTLTGAGSRIVADGGVAIGIGGTGTLAIADGASLAVAGTIAVGTSGTGLLSATGGGVTAGAFAIGAAGTVRLGVAAAAGEVVAFRAATGTLEIDDLADFHATIAGLAAGDTLVLGGMNRAAVTISAAGATTVLNFGAAGTITLAGAYAPGTALWPVLLSVLEAQARAGAIGTISLASGTTAALALSPAQIMADQDALRAIATPYVLDLSGMPEKWTGPTIASAHLGGSGLQYAQFADGRLTFDTTDPAAQAYRLFLAATGQPPGPADQHRWTAYLEYGGTLAGMAASLLASAASVSFYGGSTSNAAFVAALYQNVLGRPPEPGAVSAWAGQLSAGLPRAELLADFSESAEHVTGTQTAVEAGLWDLSEPAAEVARLYDTVFGRIPDLGGFQTWFTALVTQRLTLVQVAADFILSDEFQATYGGLSDTAFVTALYVNTLHRPPDPPGLASWLANLAAGQSRASVVLGFSESPEHQANTAPDILNADPGQAGVVIAAPVVASAAVISAGLDGLQGEIALGALSQIDPTDAGTVTIAITAAQVSSDAQALGFITGSFVVDLGAATVAQAGASVQAANLGATTGAADILFADGRLVFDIDDPAAAVLRLYASALGRAPDPQGEHHWTAELQTGTDLATVAQGFLGSQEFMNRYGANPSDDSFVTLLYANVLGRAPDPPGFAGWEATLAAGASRATVLVDFSESPEHIADMTAVVRAGIWDVY